MRSAVPCLLRAGLSHPYRLTETGEEFWICEECESLWYSGETPPGPGGTTLSRLMDERHIQAQDPWSAFVEPVPDSGNGSGNETGGTLRN
jgi:hypothetical protein